MSHIGTHRRFSTAGRRPFARWPRKRTYTQILASVIVAGATLMLALTAPPATAASDYQWKAVAAGAGYTCAIKSDDSIVCWGTGSSVQPGSQAGAFAAVSAGTYHACAIRFDGSLRCWGDFLETQGTPSGSFKAVGAGEAHTCAIRANADPLLDGSLRCWGNNDYGQTTPVPSGSFSALSTGGYHGCAIQSTSSLLRCWGYSGYVAGAPSVAVKSVSAAYVASCAIRFDDSIVCWGSNQYGQLSNVPSGSFKSLSAGATADHSCAIRFDDSIACWGANSVGQSTPPAGSFKSVAAGYGHTCAIRTDGSIVCWGSNQYGQLNVPTPPTDTTPPVITPMVTGTPGNDPWYTSDVSVSWTVTDPESAITAQIGCYATTIDWDTSANGQTLTCTATSGGGTSTKSVTIWRDATAPTLAPTISPNTLFLNGTATVDPNADDPGSGLNPAASFCPLDTSTVGIKTLRCTASDVAGNSSQANTSYTVTYKFVGFSTPVDNDGIVNQAKAGLTIPLKWRLLDAYDQPVTNLASYALTVASATCVLGATTDQIEEYGAGASGLLNLNNGYYQVNWKTPSTYAKSCKTLSLNLFEGSTHTALFEFTK